MILLPESPVKFILSTPTGGHMYRQQEFFEIYIAIVILVKVPEDVVTEFLGVC